MARLQLGLDAYSPREIAEKVQLVGVSKARLPFLQTAMLGNIVGGSVMVAAVYHLVYRRHALAEPRSGSGRSRTSDAAARAADAPPGSG